MKEFIAITSETYGKELVLINTSAGRELFNSKGIDLDSALEFLFSLRSLAKRKSVVFVVFGFSRDNEFLFSLLNRQLRDKLFQSVRIKDQIARLEFEKEALDEVYYNSPDASEREAADFQRYVNDLAVRELIDVQYKDYKLKLANGKKLVISKGKQQITIYDIYGFFKPTSLRKAVKDFCNKDIPLLDRTNYGFSLAKKNELARLRTHSSVEVTAIAELAVSLNNRLLAQGINLTRFHGATALTSWFLGRHKAKKEFHNYRYKRQLSVNLYEATQKAFFAGRAEQLKLGTVQNVHVYDINSAYGYACQFLPIMLRKPIWQKSWSDDPFSFWHLEFDLRNRSEIGLLPFRDTKGSVYFPLCGRGYYWQPEVKFLLEHYSDCVNIDHGFTIAYQRANFAKALPEFYNMRLELKKANDPLEKIFKLAIAALYGKFCQHNGKGNFYNLFYAGFITSVVRRLLLDAARNNENKIIGFLTDCIHSTEPLDLPLSDQLGEWKEDYYPIVRYLDSGIYQCEDVYGNTLKTKTKGFRQLFFNHAAAQLQDKQRFLATTEFFVGHNVYSQHIFPEAKYLENIIVDKVNRPLEGKGRKFVYNGQDLLSTYLDSDPVAGSFKESAPYHPSTFKDADLALETIEARRM